jgi:hypothetical protein
VKKWENITYSTQGEHNKDGAAEAGPTTILVAIEVESEEESQKARKLPDNDPDAGVETGREQSTKRHDGVILGDTAGENEVREHFVC